MQSGHPVQASIAVIPGVIFGGLAPRKELLTWFISLPLPFCLWLASGSDSTEVPPSSQGISEHGKCIEPHTQGMLKSH